MSVYVDPSFACLPNPKWRWRQASHLFADDLAELHAFADALGLKRSWFQNHEWFPHYDLIWNKRMQAIRAGAIPLEGKDLRDKVRQFRERQLMKTGPGRDQLHQEIVRDMIADRRQRGLHV